MRREQVGRHISEDCTSLLDSVLHVSGVLERRQVGVERRALPFGRLQTRQASGTSDDCFCHRSSAPDSVDPSFPDYLQDKGRRKFSCSRQA